eukprot:TRINITY_DN30456_c0_g3_i1.p1 TRINITY_DN30456_c0_g3~~TRINITY_DN30456_c0_g3_i1.p1  ORF type:complete len:217 (+),score=58.36 TRINITY_DN30456_c0_g3_i1:339-989(+)
MVCLLPQQQRQKNTTHGLTRALTSIADAAKPQGAQVAHGLSSDIERTFENSEVVRKLTARMDTMETELTNQRTTLTSVSRTQEAHTSRLDAILAAITGKQQNTPAAEGGRAGEGGGEARDERDQQEGPVEMVSKEASEKFCRFAGITPTRIAFDEFTRNEEVAWNRWLHKAKNCKSVAQWKKKLQNVEAMEDDVEGITNTEEAVKVAWATMVDKDG